MRELEYRGRLGDGAEADVWRAWDSKLERLVAVKVFRPSCADNVHVLEQARALARVASDYVIKVYDFDEVEPPEPAGRHPAVLMEIFAGEKLGRRLTGGMFSRSHVRAVGLGLLDGLADIHAAGVAHGDLHDGNVLVADNGSVRIIDILYRGTLAVLSTASREEKVRKDVRSLLAMLSEIMFHSDLDPEASQRLRRLSRDSLDIPILRGAFEEALADFEPRPGSARVLTAPMPDVRVTVGAGVTYGQPHGGRNFLMVTVANHSPARVYLQSLMLPLPDRHLLVPQVDAIYGRPIHAPVLESGDSWQVPLDAAALAQSVSGDLSLIQSVVITDKIGREYKANGPEVRAKLREVLTNLGAAASPPGPAQPTKPDELQLDILNNIAEEYLRSGEAVAGRRVRTRLREVGRQRVDDALNGCVPAWLRRGALPPHEHYTPTLAGLVLTHREAEIGQVVGAIIGFLRDAVQSDVPEIKLTPAKLRAHADIGDVGVPYLAAVLAAAQLSAGGNASGRPYTDFEYYAPVDLEDVIECNDLADLLRLRARGHA